VFFFWIKLGIGVKEMGEPAFNILGLIRKRSFFHEFQPLWMTETEEIFAYEALIRTEPRINPILIFQYGREQGTLFEFDAASISNAIYEYPESYFEKYFLFVNIFPSTIVHHKFSEFVEELVKTYPMIKGKVVFEINEDPVESYLWVEEGFVSGLELLKSKGFRIALDDLGLTAASIEKIARNKPDFAKLDRSCSVNLAKSINKQKNIYSILSKSDCNMVMVLEGIEKKEDLIMASRLGVPAVQGYYIAKPHRL
jgi:EAL domain-containing protein (putative c-di-GMP-specific phosphodiesterase class I)